MTTSKLFSRFLTSNFHIATNHLKIKHLNLYAMNKIIENIRTIRETKGYSQEFMAEKMTITQPKYARFERGATKTDLKLVMDAAEVLEYELIDIITYPKKFVDIETFERTENNQVKAILQIELKKEKKDQVLKLVFGDNNLEILNK